MPQRSTIARAKPDACWMSPAGPFETLASPYLMISAAFPAIVIAIFSSHSALCQFNRSISGKDTTIPRAPPRGIIVALYTGSH